jgi:hypothetical protein
MSPYLKWQSISETESMSRIKDESLAEALEQKHVLECVLDFDYVFDREECKQLQLQKHPRNCYVEVHGKYYSPAGPSYDHNVPDEDVTCLLQSVAKSHEKRDVITQVMKKFGYKKQWLEWSSGIASDYERASLEIEWQDADTETDLDLNYIVKLTKPGTKVPKIEKIYFNELKLSEANLSLITNRVNKPFLSPDLLDTGHRVTALKSGTGSGKTQATIDYAKKKGMPVLSVSCMKSQVDEHYKTFQNKLLSRTVKYNIAEDVCSFEPGADNYVTTLNSLPKLESRLQEQDMKKCILYLDETHSLLDYLIRSPTLDKIRKSVISSLSRLFKHAGKVVISDNEIDDRDLQFINLMRRVSGGFREPIDFIVNVYKKYTEIKVLHTNDVEEQIGHLKQDIENSLPFTCPCNTKKMADRLAM